MNMPNQSPSGRWGLVAPFKLGDTSKPVQIFRTGKWDFDDYGEVEITPDDIKEFVKNFHDNVRRQQLPINIEHDHTLGAIGWVRDITANDDYTAAYMVPEWNTQGQDLITRDAFRYTSPEFFRTWRDPEKKVDHRNVVSAVAVTNFPRLKEMATIAASEDGTLTTPLTKALRLGDSDPDAMPAMDDKLAHAIAVILGETIQAVRSLPKVPEKQEKTAGTPEPELTALSELQTRVLAAEADAKAAKTALSEVQTALAEQKTLLAVEQSARIKLECGEIIDKAKRQGRITPAQAEVYATEFPKMDSATRQLWFTDLENRPVVLPLGEVGSGEEGTDESDGRNSLAQLAEQILTKASKKGRVMSAKDALLEAGKQMATKGA